MTTDTNKIVMLSLPTGIPRLNLADSQLYQLETTSSLAHLVDLSFDFNTYIDLEHVDLSYCTALHTLAIAGCNLTSLSCVAWQRLERLTSLDVKNNRLSSMPSLSAQTQLAVLDVAYNQLTSIDGICDATSLCWLEMASNPQLIDVNSIVRLTNLHVWRIKAASLTSLPDLSPLSRNLQQLFVCLLLLNVAQSDA
jgi:Leucine-rich repeat (LRR) protein